MHWHTVSMGDTQLSAKIITVSDGVIAGTREDKSGDALAAHLTEAGYEIVDRRQISDGVDSVAQTLEALAKGFNGLIVKCL